MKAIPILVAFDFNEDDNGALIVRVYDDVNNNQVMTWREFISQKSEYARRLYWYTKHNFSILIEQSGTNDSHERMFVSFRRFIAHWMAGTATKLRDYNFIIYTDGSIEARIDQQTCAQNCPHLLRLKKVLNDEMYTQSNHAVEFVEYQMERMGGGMSQVDELVSD